MAGTFEFMAEPQDELGDLKIELPELYEGYKEKYFSTEGRKRDHLKGLSGKIEQMREDVKSDWQNLSGKKREQLMKSKGLKMEKSDMVAMSKESMYPGQEHLRKMSPEARRETFREDPSLFTKLVPDAMVDKIATKWSSENKCYNDWRLKYDDAFARKYAMEVAPRIRTPTSPTCPCCKYILIDSGLDKSRMVLLMTLLDAAERCHICTLLAKAFVGYADGNDGTINFFRTRSALRAGSGGKRLLRFCAGPGFADHVNYHIPVGIPILPDSNHVARFKLLRGWLRWCDEYHECNKRSQFGTSFPTRVLWVGDPNVTASSSGYVRLMNAAERRSDSYVTLSHCWGNLPDMVKQTYCTTRYNFEQRRAGFLVSELPQTFQDAIEVTRALGIPYLWIDSLCIIQYGDNGEDWNRESSRMKDVFSQAYCTIAATAATDSFTGFLKRDVNTECIRVQDDSGMQFYMSTDVDDFDQDVDNAILNTRAWVMQEAVLSRRTIRFSLNQTYWECGEGIYCENLTRLTSPPRNRFFTLDPDFPTRLLKTYFRHRTVECISYLVEEYSKRHLTVWTDRVTAIAGLEERLVETLRCESIFGVFKKFLHRNIFWMACGSRSMRIEYKAPMPSWSWMANVGEVRFMVDSRYRLDINRNLRFHKTRKEVLSADLGRFQNCTFQLSGNVTCIMDTSGSEKGRLRFDIKGNEYLRPIQCVVVGRFCFDRERKIAEQEDHR